MKRFLSYSAIFISSSISLSCVLSVKANAQSIQDPIWDHSQWISVVDAPIVTGPINGSNVRSADGASWFLTSINNDKAVKSAVWTTTGLGVYQLYVNGHLTGEEILKPGFTHVGKTRRSFTYDVTDAFNNGKGQENTLSVQVTPGWWADKIVSIANNEGMNGKKPAFRGVLEVTYTDGEKRYYGSNTEDWFGCIGGPVTHASIFDGEEYDARVAPVFQISEIMAHPEINSEFNGEILPSQGAEVYFREDLTLEPVRLYVWSEVKDIKDGEYGTVVISREYKAGDEIILDKGENLVIDFGQNCAAVPEFVFSSTEGTQLKFLPAEILNDGNGALSRGMDGPEGSVHRTNLRLQDTGIRLYYTFGDNDKNAQNQCQRLNGKEDKRDKNGKKNKKGKKGANDINEPEEIYVTYRPQCSFFGYRYANVATDGKVKIKSINSIPVTSITKEMENGTITTGNDDINQLISNTLWGMRSNYLSVPTDCPQRDERLGWMADTQVFTETGTFFANTNNFFRKWLRDVRDTQLEGGGYPGVAPYAQYGSFNTESRLGWADAGIIVPWTIWKQFGDPTIVKESWVSMEKYMDHIDKTEYDHFKLRDENGDYQWADWLSYEPLESCSGRKNYKDGEGRNRVRPETYEFWNFLSGCYWQMDAQMMAQMADALVDDDEVTRKANKEKYNAMAERARKHVTDKFLNEDGTFKCEILNTMQTPALFALKCNLLEDEAKDNMIRRLRENFREHNNCLQTGFLGTSILMQTLTENGMEDIAYELLFQRKNPSWLYSIDNGATTIWERWNSYTKESGMGPSGMNSFNHYAYGCVCQWLWETAAGISADPKQPAFKHIIMKPIPDKRLGHLDAVYNSAAGPIESSWKYVGDDWIWTFSLPEGATASVTLPGQTTVKEYGPGRYQINQKLSK